MASESLFRAVFGFDETSGQAGAGPATQFESKVDAESGNLFIKGSGPDKWWQAGRFETPSLAELRAVALIEAQKSHGAGLSSTAFAFDHIVADSNALHSRSEFEGAVFQAASQFNCLEFASPSVVPERGISGYVFDRTQGPACATACFAGTAQRNYLHRMPDGQIGQTAANQINCLADIEALLASKGIPPSWRVKNGYIESSNERLVALNVALRDKALSDAVRAALRVGVHWDTEVTTASGPRDRPLLVTQVYASAVSVGYSLCSSSNWEPFASLVLEAAYEATVLVGVLNNLRRLAKGLPVAAVVLTKVGGGVFRNEASWIRRAIVESIRTTRRLRVPMAVRLTHFGAVEDGYEDLATALLSPTTRGS